MTIGDVGELIFTKRAFNKIGKHDIEYDQVVKVFAPNAWLYYEYKALKCSTCRKDPDTCGAVFGGDNGCFRYESIDD